MLLILTGVAIDSTYCGLNSIAVTDDSFWSVTAGTTIIAELAVPLCYMCIIVNQKNIFIYTVECFRGTVRLVNIYRPSYNFFEGRVEVCINFRWGTVCGDHWDRIDAVVLCRQLNFTSSSKLQQAWISQIVTMSSFVNIGIIINYYTTASVFGQGSGPIHMSNIACNGTEILLQSCPHNSSTGDCSHAQDVGVRCRPRKMNYYIPNSNLTMKFGFSPNFNC